VGVYECYLSDVFMGVCGGVVSLWVLFFRGFAEEWRACE
jgi:hypothetical protein